MRRILLTKGTGRFFEPIPSHPALTEHEVLAMKVAVETIGKVGSRARVGGHELVFDQPASVPGGEDRGPSPLDVMSVAVAACAHYFAAAYLHGRGLSPEGLKVEVAAEKERVPVPRIGRLVMQVHLPRGLEARHLPGIERAIKSCPAYGTLLHPPSVELSIDAPETDLVSPDRVGSARDRNGTV